MKKKSPDVLCQTDIQLEYKAVPMSQSFYSYEVVRVIDVIAKGSSLELLFEDETYITSTILIPLTQRNKKRIFKILYPQIGVKDNATDISILFNDLIDRRGVMVTCNNPKCKKVLHDLILIEDKLIQD